MAASASLRTQPRHVRYSEGQNTRAQQRSLNLALKFSAAMAIIVLIGAVGASVIWLLTGRQYPQFLALIGTCSLIAAGAGVYRLALRLDSGQQGIGLMWCSMLLGVFLVPFISPALLPAGVAAMVLLSLAGQALLGARRGLLLTVICMAALLIDYGFAQVVTETVFGAAQSSAFAASGIIIVGNVPVILGFIVVGRQIILGYETALADEHTLVRMMIDNLPDNLFVKDRDSRILIDNVAHARLLGNSTPDQVVGKTDFDFFPPELAQKYFDDEQQMIRSGESKINIEEPTIDAEGNHHWLLTTKVLVYDADHRVVGIVGVNRDITLLKQAETERDRLLNVEQEQRVGLEQLIEQVRTAAAVVTNAATEIEAAATQQVASTLEQEATVTQTVATVEELRTTVAQTAERAQQVATASRQSLAVSKAGQEAVADSINGMNLIRQRVGDIAHNILVLSEHTQQIGEIIDTVNGLADQSKLLALNASIEAARAGEEGKGFAVVAMEVRQLAEQSRAATARVRDILSEIQQATNTAVMVTEEGSKGAESGMALVERAGEAIRELAATVESAAQVANQIAASTHQQANGMEQLVGAMSQIRAAVSQTAASTRQTEQSVRNLIDVAQQLEQAASRS